MWSLRRADSQEFLLVVSNNTNISGVELDAVRLLGPLGSPLLLRGVGPSLNGISVVCLIYEGALRPQEKPFATLSVQCESL